MKQITQTLLCILLGVFVSVTALCSTVSDQQWQDITDRLRALEHCQDTNSCPQDPSSPRNSFYLLGEEINQELDRVAQWQRDFGSNAESRALLHHFLKYQNEFVQEKVLTILREMPADDDTVAELLALLPDVRDKRVLIPLLIQLQRYPKMQSQVDKAFAQVLERGSFEAGKVLAQHIQPFLGAENLAFYQQLHSQLPPQSAKARALAKAIAREKSKQARREG
ncbi:hypothetical protein [uncultured Microbulbifer sp.]|uniref:hypothetical protein n=1 Tax=uncultured Microbulbifer sp. TaxID=348147 RepID=UPI0025E40FC8|nr:hypothetical protein [uncultured Microbulbifer sp.]